MVSWQRDSSIESTEMIVQTAQRYAYFWGKQYFDEITSKLQAAIKAKKLAITLLDFIDLDIEYHGTGMLKFEFSNL
jgi:protoheme ferro-lyase